ncbi:hypothetical protein PBI_LUCKY2013_179 [Mycobacterium phage Lucky2013]|uniref:Uncharacterized protein n=2 Tax=Omegavirus courthouse TaxID=1089119 RepID=G8I5N7_9CAUD|nr:hypothetical protein CM09_gp180 [Mycobacterium phage Courthouse]YP_009205314.1 hypothetical protein AVT17_gp184 [Mycobacterium phage Ariel]YP_009213403.1 hypothetical protein AVV70_gp186 [Mycobacterium phage MiaZeal]ASD50795.1 hypothetical protein PORCELAIN_183 [Mycobacterium phage Porcelain]ASD53572.1 hypothetical protein PBI_LUCKY2013_179 [Mycobacterium phage Lucky2013]ATS93021.1 hypothetical protein SEA_SUPERPHIKIMAN_181 [Mycobacterium phage Superphikiman]AER48031.1 hypothetical protein
MGVMPEKEGEMPKEYIGQEPQEYGSIEVAWGKDSGYVQVSVAGPAGWREPTLWPIIAPMVGGRRESPYDPDKGLDWHVELRYRHEINHLIRVLRRARDQAFGKDE